MTDLAGRRTARIGEIMRVLATGLPADVTALADRLGVSAATIRRDLAILAEQRLITRVHGGAAPRTGPRRLPETYRRSQRVDTKRRVAALAATLVPLGRLTVGLTGGTTVAEVRRILATRRELTLVTNAWEQPRNAPGARMLLTGGQVRSHSLELVGEDAEAAFRSHSIDIAVVGVDGLTCHGGLSTFDAAEASVNRALIDCAHRVIVVADSSKLGVTAPATIAPLAEAHDLVTDLGADPAFLHLIAALGPVVHLTAQ